MRTAAVFTLSILLAGPSVLHAQAEVPLWRVEAVARAGAGDGPGALTYVSDVTIGRDGTLYVAQPREKVVKTYTPAGRYLRSIGREGAGPGEFESPGSLGWRGDTLWVTDPAQTRISLFRPDGTFLRAITFSHASQVTEGRTQIPAYLLADGSVLGWWQVPLQLLSQGRVVSSPMVRFTARGEPIGVIGRRESRNEFGELAEGNSRTYFPQKFTDTPLEAVAPDGSSIVIVRRDAATSPARTVFSVQRMDASGRVTLSRNYSYRPIPLSSGAVDRALDEHVRGLGQTRIRTPEAAVLRRQLRRHLYRPRFLPPVTALVLGRDGTIWLRREELGRSMAWWHVLDPSGRIVGRAWVPATLDVRYADRAQIWGVEMDEFDVPTLVRFRIVPSP
ncbi:MAG: hypothetical protein KY467_13255 [Gemmatimonadetes bacterium]|nr:hypothetical protein [Gemmatimonadota bacterium]